VCGSDKFLVAYKQTFAPLVGASILDGYDVCVCENCGMVFANNIPSQKEFDDYYANSNKWESVNKDHQVDSYHLVDSKLYNYVLDHVDKNTAIADLGCGSGVDLLHLQKLGFTNLYGVDTSESNCKYLKAGGGY
jgi:SAM-dependent methyltransferase